MTPPDFIEPITCSNCGQKGRPGDKGFISHGWFVTCNTCEQKMEMQNPRDQNILADNIFGRIFALSNHGENAPRKNTIGKSERINFARPFDYVGLASFAPHSNTFFVDHFNPYYSDPLKDHMIILTSNIPGSSEIASEIEYDYAVFGLVNAQSLPSWYILFYNAISNLEYYRQYRTAFLEYSIAFEAFIEQFLVAHLTAKYDAKTADELLEKTGRMEDRVKQLLEDAIGHRLSENPRIYQPWDEDVRKPRNKLIHGTPVPIGKGEAERAHQAIYQAIRWIQRLVGQEMPLDKENLCCSNKSEPGRAMEAVKSWGAAVGTGRPQAIPHGLSVAPKQVHVVLGEKERNQPRFGEHD
jgi:hypothetical protein